MLKARMVKGSVLKKVVEVTRNVAGKEAKLVFSTTGFSLQATNLSTAAMVAILIPSDAFDRYQCDCTISVGTNLEFMSWLFREYSDGDIITIKALHGVERVTFIVESPSKFVTGQRKVSKFWMNEKNIDQEKLLEIPEAEYHAILKMNSLVFARFCRELAGVGDSVTIKIIEKAAIFTTKGELETVSKICREDLDVDKPEDAAVIERNETVSVTFSLGLINSLTKTAPLSDRVTISFLREMPCVVEYKIAETGYARFYLQPIGQNAEQDELQEKTKPQE